MAEPLKVRLLRCADGIDKVRDDVTMLPVAEAFQLADDCLRATAILLRLEAATVPDVSGDDITRQARRRFHDRPA